MLRILCNTFQKFSFRSEYAKAQPFSSFIKRFREPCSAYMHSAMDATPINQGLNNAHPRSTASMLGV